MKAMHLWTIQLWLECFKVVIRRNEFISMRSDFPLLSISYYSANRLIILSNNGVLWILVVGNYIQLFSLLVHSFLSTPSSSSFPSPIKCTRNFFDRSPVTRFILKVLVCSRQPLNRISRYNRGDRTQSNEQEEIGFE